MTGPIKLLDFFKTEDKDFFYGRSAEGEELRRLIETFPLVVLTGESGTGKTSLLQAGLIPFIEYPAVYHRINPESRTRLEQEIEGFSTGNNDKKLIILDQFEEYLLGREEGSEWFPSTKLLPLISDSSRILLLSLRSDYLPMLMMWMKETRIHFHAEQFIHISRFSRETAAEVLRKILNYHGIEKGIEGADKLATALTGLDLEESVYPPHIQIVASHIVRNKDAGSEYEKLPEIEDVLTAFFETEIFSGFSGYEEKLTKDLLDILVGRAGLRRKFTTMDLSRRLNEPEPKIAAICARLIDRRVLRRTEEERIELIHDFLSKHFFEGLSLSERKKRRYQDMFYSSYMDYSEAGILLDEKRLRLFLHYRDWLHIGGEERLFILKSILTFFDFGNNFYLRMSMLDDIRDIFFSGDEDDFRFASFSKAEALIPYAWGEELKNLLEFEESPRLTGVLLRFLAKYDSAWTMERTMSSLRNWESLPDTVLEEVLQIIPHISSPVFIDILTDIVREHPTESIQQYAVEALLSISDDAALERYFALLEEGAIRYSRIIDSSVYSALSLVRTEHANRFTGLLEKCLADKDAESCPNLYSVYISHARPDAVELGDMLENMENLSTLEGVIGCINEKDDPAYADVLISLEKSRTDTYVLAAIFRALRELDNPEASAALCAYYEKYGSPVLKSDILYGLIRHKHPQALEICREAVKLGPNTNRELFLAAISGLGALGDISDFRHLCGLIQEYTSMGDRLDLLDSLKCFPAGFAGERRRFYTRLWDEALDNDVRSELACSMIKLGMELPLPYIAERIQKIDEEISRETQSFIAARQPEPVLPLLQVLLFQDLPDETTQVLKRPLTELINQASNRVMAALGIIVYAVLFGKDEGAEAWFRSLAEEGDGPEIRGCAAAALTVVPSGESFSDILNSAESPGWPVQEKLAMYALGIYPCSPAQHRVRLELFIEGLREEKKFVLFDFYIWLTGGCANAEDLQMLEEELLNRKETVPSFAYREEAIRGLLERIQHTPKEDRMLSGLRVMFQTPFIGWYNSFNLFP